MTSSLSVGVEKARSLVNSHKWWYHSFEIYPGVWTPGVYDPSGTLKELNLSADMKGMRILEIGPADGYFTKILSSRGAIVTAVDYAAKDHYGFAIMEQLSGTSYDFRHCNIFDLDPSSLGSFDMIICLGVLYHLPDLLRGLWKLSTIKTKHLILETFVSTKFENQGVAEYLHGVSPNGDYTNFWAPTPKCCELMLSDVGFRVDKVWQNDTRAMFHCSTEGQVLPTKKMRVAYTALEN